MSSYRRLAETDAAASDLFGVALRIALVFALAGAVALASRLGMGPPLL